ncbi:hypothetical protein ACWDR3_33700 [Streptomyces sp. NPDC001002]
MSNPEGPAPDPRAGVEALDDHLPVLMLPLRLETRFSVRDQELWVRVFPDDIAVDTFEEVPSVTEKDHTRRFWAHVWSAGLTDPPPSAWRALVAAHGTGRSLWLLSNYRPVNEADRPVRPENTVILASVSTPAADRAAASRYWERRWRAPEDPTELAAALTELRAAVGGERATAILASRPEGLDAQPPEGRTRANTDVVVATLEFPPDTGPQRDTPWSAQPHVDVMPEQLVLIGIVDGEVVLDQLGGEIPTPLPVGPDPSAPPPVTATGDEAGQEPLVPDDLAWLVDFDRAVRSGLGFRVTLSEAAFQRGFDTLFVVGVKVGGDGRNLLTNLLGHHESGRAGLDIVPQGTPTNNTEESPAGFRRAEDAYPIAARVTASPEPPVDEVDDPAEWTDGRFLAYWLGLAPQKFAHLAHAGGTDVRDARAMNVALWPATLGYWFDTLMAAGTDDSSAIREFHDEFVSGRGQVPAIRVGHQPYGILPSVAYRRLEFSGRQPFLGRFAEVLRLVRDRWEVLAGRLSQIGAGTGDPHQVLLDVLGLHPSSVEYRSRHAESLAHVVNLLRLRGRPEAWASVVGAASRARARGLGVLGEFGFEIGDELAPQLFDLFFLSNPVLLTGPVIDDVPLSETELVRASTPDNRNYLTWLADSARTSLETLRRQQGFTDPEGPSALLYMMLRHSMMLGYQNAALQLYQDREILDAEQVRLAKREGEFVHVAPDSAAVDSRWHHLYQREPRIVGESGLLVAEFIPQILDEGSAAAHLRKQVRAVEHLAGRPTAKLERVFAEHIDICSYRLDAWFQGLTQARLTEMRGPEPTGLHLGAYGWLENVRPNLQPPTELSLDDEELRLAFQPAGERLLRDPRNAGYQHAPSLNQAVTAAVLRNGYLSNATPQTPSPFAVNLSSDRVRRAIAVIEGRQAGHSLGSLLGYQLERGLHDRHDEAEVDVFIFALRKAFPLRADRLESTRSDNDTPVQQIEARNVVDGLALVEHVEASGRTEYPFGLILPDASAAQQGVLKTEIERLRDTHDAVADVGIAEGVHQMLMGNIDRAAASLDAFGAGQMPPSPSVVTTPRSGAGLTHRVGLHLRPGLAADHAVDGVPATPRSMAEPAVDDWLAGLLPPANLVVVVVRLEDPTGPPRERVITQAQLGLHPIDLLQRFSAGEEQAMTALDDRITRFVAGDLRPDGTVTIAYTQPVAGKVTFFELEALLRRLRDLLLPGRVLLPPDLVPPGQAQESPWSGTAVVDEESDLPVFRLPRLAAARAGITPSLEALRTLAAELDQVLTEPVDTQAVIAATDARLTRFVDAAADLALCGLPGAGFGFALQRKQVLFAALIGKVAGLLNRWQDRLASFADLLERETHFPPTAVADRFALLGEAERLVAVSPTTPLPATPAQYRTRVLLRRADFVAKQTDFEAVSGTTTRSLASLLTAVTGAAADLADFDPVRLDLAADATSIVDLARDVQLAAANLVTDLDDRIARQLQAETDYAAEVTPAGRVDTATRAATALLGDDALFVPEFSLPAAEGTEFIDAFHASNTLLAHLTTDPGLDFPVDDWLHGIARVRERMNAWEAVYLLAPPLARAGGQSAEPVLHPLQLPFAPGESWLAMEFPEGSPLDREHLLYTAHYADAPTAGGRFCGLLLDEWSEVVPESEETTGVSFHYNKPDSEPPNVLLLLATPVVDGAWAWRDVVDGVREALEMARCRAIEPRHLSNSEFGSLLPATIMAHTFTPITIALDLTANNAVAARAEARDA